MGRFPKVVATFTYAGAVNPLRNKLNGAILNAIRPTILALRDAAELVEKIKIIQLPDDLWQYYPKVVTTRPFTAAEYAQVNAAVQTVSTTLVTELTNEGATNILIHAHTVS
jgi:hypothetical protein